MARPTPQILLNHHKESVGEDVVSRVVAAPGKTLQTKKRSATETVCPVLQMVFLEILEQALET
jgi:hypothetical protein